MTLPRSLGKTLVTVAFAACLLVPAAVALAAGWIEIHFTAWGDQPGPDPTPIEAWVLLALVYVVWVPLVLVGMVLALDRLGYKYTPPPERDPRPSRRERRRRDAGLRYLQSREAPPRGAPAARPGRGAQAPPTRPGRGATGPPDAGADAREAGASGPPDLGAGPPEAGD